MIIIIIIIITLLSLNIYKHVCDKYIQTNNCVYEKKKMLKILLIRRKFYILPDYILTIKIHYWKRLLNFQNLWIHKVFILGTHM
jgi:hypothetical protein